MIKDITVYYRGLAFSVIGEQCNPNKEIARKLLEIELDNDELTKLLLALIDCTNVIEFLDKLMIDGIITAYEVETRWKGSKL